MQSGGGAEAVGPGPDLILGLVGPELKSGELLEFFIKSKRSILVYKLIFVGKSLKKG